MESIILKVCIIYLIICFVYFVACEILSNISAREKNGIYKYTYKMYKVNHGKILVKSIFFPIAILMGVIDLVSELIFEKEIKKKGK
nr:MAG TPA: hypothetical protein [Caudoviricetes sp.]